MRTAAVYRRARLAPHARSDTAERRRRVGRVVSLVTVNDPAALVIATFQQRLEVLVAAVEAAGWRAHGFADARTALDALRHGTHGLVVCDGYLRGASPAGFLAWSRRLEPKRPFFVVQGADVAARPRATEGPDGVLAFPPAPGSLPRPGSDATGPASAPPHPAASELPLEGTTSLVPLPDLIEMLALTAEGAVVTLHGATRGRVWIDGATLVHVEADEAGHTHTGVRALAHLLGGDATDFDVGPFSTPTRRTVHVPTPAAITEAARLVDETRREAALLRTVADAVPDVLGLAVGYPLNDAPTTTLGDGATAFVVAKELLEGARSRVGNASHLAIEGDRHAFAALRFGEGSIVAAFAPRGRSLLLLAALTKAVRSTSR